MLSYLGLAGREVLAAAAQEAERANETYVGTEHILLALIENADECVTHLVTSSGTTAKRLVRDIQLQMCAGDGYTEGKHVLTPRAEEAVRLAYNAAEENAGKGPAWVGPEHLLVGLIATGDGLAHWALSKQGVDLASTKERLAAWHRAHRILAEPLRLKTYADLLLADASAGPCVPYVLEPGTHEMETIDSPLAHERGVWIVLKGTRIGLPEPIWAWWEEVGRHSWGQQAITFE